MRGDDTRLPKAVTIMARVSGRWTKFRGPWRWKVPRSMTAPPLAVNAANEAMMRGCDEQGHSRHQHLSGWLIDQPDAIGY
jgi:hypothetical protein